DAEWTELNAYFSEKAPDEVKRKIKTTAAKKNWITKDDRGIDGVIVIPDVNKKRVRIGTKMSTESVRQSQHESGTARDEAYQKQSKKLDLQVNEQACGRLIFPFTAEEDQALGGPLEPDEPADEADPQSDSDSSDAGFGLMKDSKAKSAAAPKKGVKPRRQPDETEKPQPAPARPSRSSPEELQQKGEELLMTLRGFSPVGFFTGALKEKDWDGKLNKTLTFVGQLETFDDEESKNVAKGLQQTAEEITDRMETLKGVKGL
ncbi:unnamed protein product, partial [Durusdinium trenchii]